MSYRHSLLTRWSRHDRLAILGTALVVALVVGSALMLAAGGDQTKRIAAQTESNLTVQEYDSASAAHNVDGTRLPLAKVTIDGTERTLVGVPPGGTTVSDALPAPPPENVAFGPPPTAGRHHIKNDIILTVRNDQDREVFPTHWLVASSNTVERVGPEEALVLREESSDTEIPTNGVPLVSALAFFVGGSQVLLRALLPLTAGATVLASIVIFSLVRMTVRDRLGTVYILRATGASPRTILGLFAGRASMQIGVGLALGYGLGVIAVSAIVTIATFAGLPITLNPQVTGRILWTLIPAAAAIGVVGVAASVTAALPAVRQQPAALVARARPSPSADTGRSEVTHDGAARSLSPTRNLKKPLKRVRGALRPRLLDRRAVVPAIATLSVLIAAVLLVTATNGALAPLINPAADTVVEPGRPHPVASQVPDEYATTLRSQGVAASPEILLFESVDGRPLLARGANYSAFAAVSDAGLARGRPPQSSDEAVVGADLARAQDISVGDRVLLGGSTDPALARVEVVGVYRARGYLDDQLLVSLSTGRHLAGLPPGTAHMVRAEQTGLGAQTAGDGQSTVITGLTAPETAVVGQPLRVSVRVRNVASEQRTRVVTVSLGETSRSESVTLPPGKARTVELTLDPTSAGQTEIRAGPVSREVTVRDRTGAVLNLQALPDQGPPNATLLIGVTQNQSPATGATVRAGAKETETDKNGVARIRLPGPGSYRVETESASHNLRVVEGAQRQVAASVRVVPDVPSLLTAPTARVTVRNPWDRRLDTSVTVDSPSQTHERDLSLAPGETQTLRLDVGRAPAGSHTVTVSANGTPVAQETYNVRGDDRLASAVATSGRAVPNSGLGAGVASIFGNLEVLFAGILALAGFATVGTIAAGFATSVHARRETIGIRRAVGAPPRRVLRLVVADAARIAVVAVVPAVVIGYSTSWLLGVTGVVTLFGVSIVPEPSGVVLLGAALAGIIVACCGALIAAIPMVRTSPADLLSATDRDAEVLAPRTVDEEQG